MSKTPNPIDVHVGQKVRARRLLVGMSQDKLGTSLGITFQQIQKYEKGTNRIGASRLQQISQLLQVPVSYFFENADETASAPGGPVLVDHTLAVASTSEGMRLIKSFAQIQDPKTRRSIADLCASLAPPLLQAAE